MTNDNYVARKIASLKRRAKKVDADEILVDQYVGFIGGSPPYVISGLNSLWKSRGVIAVFTQKSKGEVFTDYELTVRTVWSGMDFTKTTRIEKRTAKDGDHTLEVIAEKAVTTYYKPNPWKSEVHCTGQVDFAPEIRVPASES